MSSSNVYNTNCAAVSTSEWVKGHTNGKVPYIAYHDQSDTDVASSGLLLGLSCQGDYLLESAYFKSDDTYTEGLPLIAHTGGELKVSNVGDGSTAQATGDIIGFVRTKVTTTDTNSEGGTLAGPNYAIQWETRWTPKRA